jgi:L-amino acid N-acyltransferase YncA
MIRILLRPMQETDWRFVAEIYRQGIESGEATFETAVPRWKEWDAAHLARPRLAATLEAQVTGWAALSRVSPRAVYTGVAEVSVYVAASARGRGVGSALLWAS